MNGLTSGLRSVSLLATLLALFVVPVLRGVESFIAIEGRLAGQEGRPLANAAVELSLLADSPPPSATVTVPPSGGFLLRAPAPGLWRVVARAEGAAPMTLDLIPLVEATKLPLLLFSPARSLAVRVTDPHGKPVAGAEVRAVPVSGKAGTWQPAPVVTTTGQDGTASLQLAASAPLRLTVAAPGFGPETIEADQAPVVFRLRAGVPVALEARDATGRPVSGATVTATKELRGQVVDGVTGLPLPGALVWAEGLPVTAIRSDSQGRYTLRIPFSLSPTLRAAAAGYFEASLVPARQEARIALHRGRGAAGRVVDRNNRPVVDADVRLLPASVAQGSGGLTGAREAMVQTVTDQDGRFSIARLAQGVFDLRAKARGYSPTLVRGIRLQPGQGAADLGTIVLEPGVAVEGRIVDPAGSPIQMATVYVTPAGGLSPWDAPLEGQAPGWEVVSDGNGEFALEGFRPGDDVTLRLVRRGYSARTLSGLSVPSPEPLTVVLEPAARLTGTVVDETGASVAEAKILISEDSPGPGPSGVGQLLRAAETDAQGRFAAEDLEPGILRLTVAAPGFMQRTRGGLSVQSGSELEDIEVVLSRGATVEGRVSDPDGNPVAGAKVMLVDNGGTPGLELVGRPQAFTDTEGGYILEGVAEGQRAVVAGHPKLAPARRDLLVHSGTNRLDFQLEGAFEVSGRIVAADGPVEGASILLVPDGGATLPVPVLSGPDGAFRFDAVSSGRYRLQAEKPGYAAGLQDGIQVAGAPVTDLTVRLDPGGAIAGRLLGLDSADLAQAEVVASSPESPGQAGRVDHAGRYRVEGLGPGDWTITASLPSKGREVNGRVTLGRGQKEASLDLELGSGLTLSGRVERAGAPVASAVVSVADAEGLGGDAVTGLDGRFRVEGLRPGAYAVMALHPRSGLRLDQNLEIKEDREIVIVLPSTGGNESHVPPPNGGVH